MYDFRKQQLVHHTHGLALFHQELVDKGAVISGGGGGGVVVCCCCCFLLLFPFLCFVLFLSLIMW